MHVLLAPVLAGSALLPQSGPSPEAPPATATRRPELSAAERFLTDAVSPDMAGLHLQRLTAKPHMAGTPADRETAEYVKGVLDRAGFTTRLEEYHVLLPYPVKVGLSLTHPETVRFDLREFPYAWDENTLAKHPEFLTYNGYSASGTARGEVVYAHYGRPEDFEWLAEVGVEVKGKVCLIRYGTTFRGLKVKEAQQRGAVGVLLYSDPDDDGYRKGDVYPDGPYRPRTGVQRGSIMFISDLVGDPLTPGWAAKKDAKRLRREECAWLPKIPCMPISWGNALRILERMKGRNVSSRWQGGCPTAYHTGPGPAKVRLDVVMDEKVRPIWNVVGRLRTEQTSKRYVLVGNHRDAWVFGANDPSTGSAVSLEAMRALGNLVKNGWHPRIEIRYASWDAEEQGLIGSVEHAEEHQSDLRENCLAYFNCDAAVSGDKFAASSTPELVDVLAYAAARTTAHDGKGRILTRWARGGTRPPVGNLGSGSDYTAFLCHLGIPSFDVGSRGGHGVYHSIHDTHHTIAEFLDKGFEIHASVARLLAIATHHFASADVPPIDLAAIGPYLKSSAQSLSSLPELHRSRLLKAIEDFEAATKDHEFDEAAMIAMHGAFLDDAGLPGRSWYRNLVVAPGRDLGYGATVLPGIAEALQDDDTQRVEREVHRILKAIERATAIASR